ncbi:guanine deaminase GuaD [Gottschalkia acidurici 9a]|uniref:Guanine deaminase n=1 Tax=Gottschalkia acidurici (strain ATCC 7906 / DSM 604 / BCRC 14475 / CIP 104303 / KCTC 5404 / NCIMB 10678 / 9a) TaxID=1128398 RepID=K0B099_GOTA9|nr:guanine deaminase [Gottschalkia acidurici]AFS78949.1 guanine deaminase GuaD [Gottschalkia acidurici 9a]
MAVLKILKGNIIYTATKEKFEIHEDSYLIESDGLVKGIFKEIPKEYKNVEVEDFGDSLIIPGFVDMHFHAPQFQNLGLGLDEELMPWLNKYTFPEEAKYGDEEYAKRLYTNVAKALWRNGTTRVVLFSTIHKNGTDVLMDVIDKSGIGAYIGKINMDRNSPDFYIEDTDESLKVTEEWILDTKDKYKLIKPIITPSFVPACTEKLMKGLSDLSKKYNVKIQSHLSENEGEIEWVKDLHPEYNSYASVYDGMGLLNDNTVMAHTVHSTDEEIKLLAERGTVSAHCPNGNYNLSSGIMPVRRFLESGVKVALGSDVGAGHQVGIYKVMSQAIEASKMNRVYVNREEKPLTTSEVFYLGTKAGGEFFGKVGSFEKGYEFDALVINDDNLGDKDFRCVEERLQRFIYIGDDRNIVRRYIAGKEVGEPK